MYTIKELGDLLDNTAPRRILFTVYNFIVDNGYVHELEMETGKEFDVEDFEYVSIKVDDSDRESVKIGDKKTINRYEHLIEEYNSKLPIGEKAFLMKEFGVIVKVVVYLQCHN